MIKLISSLLALSSMSTAFALPHIVIESHRLPAFNSALKIGQEANGRPLFLCFTHMFNRRQFGKTWPGHQFCNVPYAGREYIMSNYDIPSKWQFKGVFKPVHTGMPITMSREINNKPLFLCQAQYQGSIQPGKTWPGYPHCNISSWGREIIMPISSVFSTRAFANPYRHGRAHGQHQ